MTRSMTSFALITLPTLVLLAASGAKAGITCTAIHEYVDLRKQLQHAEVELKTTFSQADLVGMEADLDNHNYSFRGNPNASEFLLMINAGPDYTRGVVINASFNGQGQLRVSQVEGTVVHKLVCSRTPAL